MLKKLSLFIALLLGFNCSYAQSILNKTVSVNVTRQPLSAVLDNISRQGNFNVSYISDFIKDDSLVTVKASRKTVKQVLDMIFQGNCQYKEMGNQLIIQRAAREKWYVISGQITDAITGNPVSNASVYERGQLISTLTNEQGYFRLRLREKDRPSFASVTVSKDLYKDTAMIFSSGYDQEMTAAIKPANPIQLSIVDVNQYSHVEQTRLGRFFLSSRQRMQSLNLSEFFTSQPYQYSIIPAVGTHGKLSSQVINKVSLNMIGGYAAGLNGVEVAGVFNIDQKYVRYAQVAGVFNIVGGKVTGAQVAGLHNHVMDSVTGAQVAGFSNILKNGFTGAQVAGVYNHTGNGARGAQIAGGVNHLNGHVKGVQIAGIGNIVDSSVNGVQIAGLFNYQEDGTKGAQVAGLGNISAGTVSGVQISGLFNYARNMKGVQIGLINISDSSSGYSIGIVNFVKKGLHQLSIYHTELLDLNLAYRSGNEKLYSILTAGMRINNNDKAYAFGYGIGHAFRLSPKTTINAEYLAQALYLGNWQTLDNMSRLQLTWNRQLAGKVTLFAGPSFSLYHGGIEPVAGPGYKKELPGPYRGFSFSKDLSGWVGWQIGLNFF